MSALKNLGNKKNVVAITAACLFAAVLVFLYVLPRYNFSDRFVEPGFEDEDLLLIVGDANLSQNNSNPYPFMMFLNLRDWSIETINLKTLFQDLNVVSIVEARPFLLNGQYKLVLATRGPEDINGTVLILGKTGRSWQDLKIEFREELPYPFVRSLFVGDITGDGKEEIVVGAREGGFIKYYTFADGRWSGKTIDKLGVDKPAVAIHDLLVEDLDEDGLQEILLTAHIPVSRLQDWDSKELPQFKPKILQYKFDQTQGDWSKEIFWEYTETTPIAVMRLGNSAFIDEYYAHARYLYSVDVDGDGTKEIVATQRGGSQDLVAFKRHEDGWKQDIIEDALSLDRQIIAVGDIDNDGKVEIIAATQEHDALLLYEYEQGKWERSLLATDLIEGRPDRVEPNFLRDKTRSQRIHETEGVGSIQGVTILNSSEGKYKNILYIVSGHHTKAAQFYLFSYDPQKNLWGGELVAELEIGIHAWHMYPYFPH